MRIDVVDHGPGVPTERFQTIFDPFQRFDDRGHQGTGLGRAITRGFTEAMGGSAGPVPDARRRPDHDGMAGGGRWFASWSLRTSPRSGRRW